MPARAKPRATKLLGHETTLLSFKCPTTLADAIKQASAANYETPQHMCGAWSWNGCAPIDYWQKGRDREPPSKNGGWRGLTWFAARGLIAG